MSFPKKFVWGAAAASYQVEGAAREDGKGLSVWDMMSRWPGKIAENNTGDVACDHYHRYKQDARLMGQMGLDAYRLSVSWPRVLPQGTGKVNAKGLDFYDRLVDALLDNHVTPWVTLFHWDFPYALFCRGGWLNRDVADWFADYTAVVVDKLSDRVAHWMTLNEPQCYIAEGHEIGEHAPGLKLDFPEVLLAAHNTLRAHGKAVQAIRARARKKPVIGVAVVGTTSFPATQSTADINAARHAMFKTKTRDAWSNTWFADPIVFGHYPADALKVYGSAVPEFPDNDMKTIRQKIDFYGVNIYHGRPVKAAKDGGWQTLPPKPGHAWTSMGWPITPEALYWGPKFLYERYKLPIVMTENGMANMDWVHADGQVHDPQRIDYLRRYLLELRRASEDGVPIHGYFQWSILDNFEWGHGYRQRFGLIYVDFATGRRIPKDSARWYSEVIAANGENL